MATTTDFPRSPVPGVFGPGGEPIYRFDDAAIQKHLEAAAQHLGTSKAFVEFSIRYLKEGDTVYHFAGAVRLGDHWSAAGVFEHSKTDGNLLAGEIRLAV